jgi:hypothetical protein
MSSALEIGPDVLAGQLERSLQGHLPAANDVSISAEISQRPDLVALQTSAPELE